MLVAANKTACLPNSGYSARMQVEGTLRQTTFEIPKMDCPSEEGLIRMALEGLPAVRQLRFDLGARQLTVTHEGAPEDLLTRLQPLNLGARVAVSVAAPAAGERVNPAAAEGVASEASVLKLLLAINAAMFLVEFAAGWLAQSTGLLADSLDMFADAAVYGVSLYAVGKSPPAKRRAARLSGVFQMLLALGAFAEVVRRFLIGNEPESRLMIGVAALALVANVACVLLLRRHREGEVHMRASWIFSTNDVIANLGVIVAGVLVRALGSPLPDLMIGVIIAAVVFRGAVRILRLSRAASAPGALPAAAPDVIVPHRD